MTKEQYKWLIEHCDSKNNSLFIEINGVKGMIHAEAICLDNGGVTLDGRIIHATIKYAFCIKLVDIVGNELVLDGNKYYLGEYVEDMFGKYAKYYSYKAIGKEVIYD